jgi:hypothetical protein
LVEVIGAGDVQRVRWPTVTLAIEGDEAIWPGKYVLRKPDGDMQDNLVNRLRQFRADHPGLDGTILLGVMILLGIALVADILARFARLL